MEWHLHTLGYWSFEVWKHKSQCLSESILILDINIHVVKCKNKHAQFYAHIDSSN